MKNIKFLEPITVSNKIRVGPNRDGGYVYKPSLDNIDMLLTYGVGWDISFEIRFNHLTNKHVYMYDPTMFAKGVLDKDYFKLIIKERNFTKIKQHLLLTRRWKRRLKLKHLNKYNIFFYDEGIADKIMPKYNTFKNHLVRHNINTEKILLKIDIEGNEYSIMNSDFFDNLANVDQIILELHDLKNRLREAEIIIDHLKEFFELIHIHANNNGETFTLYKDLGDIHFPML